MARALSLDLRLRIVAALAEGQTTRAAAKRFGVSVASAVRMGQLARSGKGLMVGRIGGHRPLVLASVGDALAARLARKSDWTVSAMAADLQADGIAVSHDTVWRFLRHQGLSIKKNTDGERDGSSEAGPHAGAVASLSTEI